MGKGRTAERGWKEQKPIDTFGAHRIKRNARGRRNQVKEWSGGGARRAGNGRGRKQGEGNGEIKGRERKRRGGEEGGVV